MLNSGWALVAVIGAAVTVARSDSLFGPPPPPTCAPPVTPRVMAPRVQMDGGRVTLENTHLRAELRTVPGLSLAFLANKALGNGSLLVRGGPLFAVLLEDAADRWAYSDAFAVTHIERHSDSRAHRIQFQLSSAELGLSGRLTVSLSDEPEVLCRLDLRNDSGAERRLCVAFPMLWAVRLSGDLGDDYYFHPMVGGWCSNVPCELATSYGTSNGSLQVLSVFSPRRGGGVYLYVRDDTGTVKVMMTRKRDMATQAVREYVPLFDPALHREPAYTPLPFSESAGTSLGVRTLWMTLGPGDRLTLPEAALGVHVGDFRPPLERYTAWVRTWWQPPQTPTWPRAFASYCYAHDEDSIRQRRYVARPDINPPHQVMQWSYWWRHSDLNRLGQDPQPERWYRENLGDYEYEDRWGGVSALREEVRRYQQAGSRMVLYLQSYLVWKHSAVARQHHPEWGIMLPDGTWNEDYTDEQLNMNCWGLCPRAPGWQEYLVQTCDRLMRDVSPDGLYLDSLNNAPFCYHPGHTHEFQPAPGVRELLIRARAVIKAHNPQAILWVEFPCSDYLMQFVDFTWLETFAANVPLYTEFDRGYGLHFLRFYFPEVGYAEWNPDVWKPEMQERNLFNGIGSGTATPNDRVFRENQSAFASLHPEPLIPTEIPGVLANLFPTPTKRVYTLWNRNEVQVSGALICVPHREGFHYVELRSGREVAFEVRSPVAKSARRHAALTLEIDPGRVACVAQLPKVLQARREGNRVTVFLRRPLQDGERVMVTTDLEEPGLQAQPAGDALVAEVEAADHARPLFVKLLAGEELVDQVALGATP